jgi:hypothetical protein
MDLQAVIESSFARASSFTKEILQRPLAAESVIELVDDVHQLTVATASSSGVPHASVVIAKCVDGAILFTVSGKSVLHRNLLTDDRCAITCVRDSSSLMGQGRGVEVGAYPTLPSSVRGAFGSRLDGYDGYIFRFVATRLLGNIA